MSVLIKGMEMPKSCGECRFLLYRHYMPVCFITREIPSYPLSETLEQALSKRMDWCPLEEVSGCEYWDSESRFCSLYRPTAEPRYCDRNICASNEVNGIGCEECEIAKYHNLEDDDSPCLDCGEEEDGDKS